MKRLLSTLAAILALCAFVPYALALTKEFQVNTLSGGTLTTGLVAYYNMQGNSNDYYGSNNGTDTSVTYATSTGKVNEGAAFGGASKTSLGDPSDLLISPAVSIAAWIKMASSSSQSANIFGQVSNSIGGHVAYDLGVNYANSIGSGAITMRVEYANGTFSDLSTAANLVNDGNWHFVVVIYNAGSQKIYIDNVLKASGGSGSAIYYETNTAGAYIGYLNDGVNENFFTGDIDEVGVWSKALSTNEIADLYNGGAGQTMCNGTGGPVCAGGAKHKIIVVSFVAKPEHPFA